MEAEAELEVHGTPPELASLACDELLCEQYWHEGSLEEPANVIFLRFASDWHRLCFDHGIVFWRTQSERPAPYAMPSLESETRIDDLGARLGVAGRVLNSYEARAVPGGSEIEFRFAGGVNVLFRNVGDHTEVIT
jgi:hypothetical protein